MSKILDILQRLETPAARNIFELPKVRPAIAAAAPVVDEPAAMAEAAAPLETRLIPIASGKGGVGKTNLAVNLSIWLADLVQKKSRHGTVILVDCDFGLPNADLLLGTRETKNLEDFIAKRVPTLADVAVPTAIPGLKFLSGASTPSATLSNLQYKQRQKFLANLKTLRADYVVLDLGASVHYEVVDFFSMVNAGVVVTNPEPPALRDCFLFLRAVLMRKLRQECKEFPLIVEQLDRLEARQLPVPSVPGLIHELQRAAQLVELKTVKAITEAFQPKLVLNRVEHAEEGETVVRKIRDEARRELGIDLGYLGPLPHDALLVKAVKESQPFFRRYPEAEVSRFLGELGERLVENEDFELEKNYFSFGAFLRRVIGGAASFPGVVSPAT